MGKRLYTEADVRKLPRDAELQLGPGDIATPAALDLAFQRGIRVRRSDEAAAPRASGGPWGELLANDGTYVVEVRAGRAQVFRLTENGPVPLS